MSLEVYLNHYSNSPLKSVIKAIDESAKKSFEEASPIPAAANHSVEFYNHEQERIFNQEWICIARTDEVPNTGDFLTHDIAGTPVVIIRQESNEILGFVNACAHRFTCLVPKLAGNAFAFTCPNHAWTYGLDGSLKHAPFMEMKTNFDIEKHHLKALHTEIWEGFIYISLAKNPNKKVSSALEGLRKNIVGQYDMGNYQTIIRESMSWDANWKNLIENFTESYHVPIAHQKTFANHKKPIEDYICGEDSDHYCYHYAPQESESGPGSAHPNNTKLKDKWRRTMVDFCIFPNHLVTLMPDYLWWVSVMPDGIGCFKATWGVAIPPEILAEVPTAEYGAWVLQMADYMNTANSEDKALVQGLYRGSSSQLLPKGTLHPIEKNLWQFTKYLSRISS
jgi:choline monooxygenase